jgi:hypothetical protein
MAVTQMKLTIEKLDGSVATLSVLPITRVACERQFGTGLGALMKDIHEEHIYWMAWDAEHRSGKVVKPFDEWLATVAGIDAEDNAEADAVPLEPTATPTL